ncbi:MAG: hypothetical protein EBZ77_17425, partial [Chitinophagia bacterium]|nr:hypothetical protein [Chitinophagia bacterium]
NPNIWDSLQILYKLFVQPFGQLWLSVIFLNYTVIIITLLRERLHPIILYNILIFYFAMPELFGYTYLMLFDYSNMVFLFAGYFFLDKFLNNHKNSDLYFAVVLFSFANYIRVETIIIMAFFMPRVMYLMYKDKVKPIAIIWKTGLLMAGAAVIYFLVMNVYVKQYIPGTYNVSSDVNKNLGDLSVLFKRLFDMVNVLVLGKFGFYYFGYFMNIFMLVAAIDLAFIRKYSRETWNYLYGVFAVFFGLAFIGYLLPLADLEHTTKRGMFKLFPLMLLYFCNSPSLRKLTDIINNWEFPKADAPRPARPVAKPVTEPAVKAKAAPVPRKK